MYVHMCIYMYACVCVCVWRWAMLNVIALNTSDVCIYVCI